MEEWSAGLDHHLQIRGRGGAGDILQREAVNVALVGDEVQIRVDALARGMEETEVSNHVHDPEVLVADRGLHDLLSGWHDDERGVLHLGADGHDVLGVVRHGAGGGVGGHGRGCRSGSLRRQCERESSCRGREWLQQRIASGISFNGWWRLEATEQLYRSVAVERDSRWRAGGCPRPRRSERSSRAS